MTETMETLENYNFKQMCKLRQMKIHEQVCIETFGCNEMFFVTRVPNGWIYTNNQSRMVFVPERI